MPGQRVAGMHGDRLIADLTALARIGANPAGGIDRPTYSKAYREAANWLKDTMSGAGLHVREDAVGNVIGRIGPEGPAFVCGSHIDTVPQGGAYDGALGVLAGLECARVLLAEESRLNLAFEVVAFADEEGAYLSLLGSKAMTGALLPAEIDHTTGREGATLHDALSSYGLDPARIADAARPTSDLAGYVELHIEQGPILETENIDIGVVDSIFGIRSHVLTLTGVANHAGTTPLGVRQDALRGAAEAIADAFDAVSATQWKETRLTFGDVKVMSGASNVVPGLVRVVWEIRAGDKSAIDEIEKIVNQCFTARAQEHRLGIQTALLGDNAPTVLSPVIAASIEAACRNAGCTWRHTVSGAGHDAQSFAKICDAGMVFVPSRNGVSHNPNEYTSPDHLRKGLDVLLRICRAKCERR